jgi:hypothetical protein
MLVCLRHSAPPASIGCTAVVLLLLFGQMKVGRKRGESVGKVVTRRGRGEGVQSLVLATKLL